MAFNIATAARPRIEQLVKDGDRRGDGSELEQMIHLSVNRQDPDADPPDNNLGHCNVKAAERQLRIRQMFRVQGLPGSGDLLPRVGPPPSPRPARPRRPGRARCPQARLMAARFGPAHRAGAFDFTVESGRFSDEKSGSLA